MRISKVIIKNFRNFRDFDADFGSQIILLGENGVGKTNFFEALRLVMDSSYRPQLGESDFHDGLPKFRGTEIEVRVQFSDFDKAGDKDFLSQISDCCIQDDPPIAQVSFLYCVDDDVDDPAKATGPDQYQQITYGGDKKDLNKKAARRFQKYTKFKMIPALRDIESDMGVWRKSPMRRLTEAMNLSNNQVFLEVANEIKKTTEKLQTITPVQQLQEEIQKRILAVVECGNEFSTKIGLLPTNPDELQKLLTILVENNLSLDRASMGWANVLYLTLLLIEIEEARKVKLEEGKYEYTILAIEEPEAHLHPHLQRLVFRSLLQKREENRMPTLLSTHSPNIVSIAEPDWFVLLKKENITKQTTATSTSQLSKLSDLLKKDISRYLDANRGEVVFSKGVILVEGDAEEFLVSEFAAKLKEAGKLPCTLDGGGISICNVSGTDFDPYVQFFGPSGLNLPFVILTDGDKFVGLRDKAENLIKNASIPLEKQEEVEVALNNGDKEKLRLFLEGFNVAGYEGLIRGIELVGFWDMLQKAELSQLYAQQKWDFVRLELYKLGIFVNDWTLEAELIASGYKEEMATIYEQLGATQKKKSNFQKYIDNGEIEKVLARIEESGKGKGRFAQRLANLLDANRVPNYIEQALKYITLKVCPEKILPLDEKAVEKPILSQRG
jgi:putative ATP-dependent endonuclease of OLD family